VILPASATACNINAYSNLIFLPEKTSSKLFLADTGASLSILPHKSNARPSGPKLLSVNGENIKAWGYKPHTLVFGQSKFTFRFLLADVKNPILGNDFFKKFNLLVSPPTNQVLFRSSMQDILQAPPGFAGPVPVLEQHNSISSILQASGNVPPQVQELLQKYP
jgi:hypothetical protein